MRKAALVFLLAGGMTTLGAASAHASCVVKNETSWEFLISSGNAADQKLAAHASTTIAAGKISGKSPEGKTISGSCKDGSSLVVHEKNGVPLLMPAKK
jgi:hypothetical protein